MLVGMRMPPYCGALYHFRCRRGWQPVGVEDSEMSEHVEHDLDKLKGIGPKYREILEEVGVASIKELRHRNPAHLKEMIEQRHGTVVALSEHELRTWIDEAQAFKE